MFLTCLWFYQTLGIKTTYPLWFLYKHCSKNETLTHLTLSPCATVGLFNDMKTLSWAPADCNRFFSKWELKCYRQLEESLEFPWNEVLNETWSDWQVCSLFHWASLSSCSPSCRGERCTHFFKNQIKSQCM